MNLPLFIMGFNRTGLLQPIIICTKRPFYIAKVWSHHNHQNYFDMVHGNSFFSWVTVPGYMIIIQFAGTMDGSTIEVTQDTPGKIQTLLEEMANFYYTERIEVKMGFYKKFLL